MKIWQYTLTTFSILLFFMFSPLSYGLTSEKYNNLLNSGLPKKTLDTALKAFGWAKQHAQVHKEVLTIVDFSMPSSEKRLWVIDMNSGEILHHTLVAHGNKSGGNIPTSFSNKNQSHKSSLGVFVTENTYTGKHGYSLRINGLEKNINDNAMERSIVVHPADYATPEFVKRKNRLGRSQGCFALNPKISKDVIKDIEGGSVIYAHAEKIANNPRYASISLDTIVKNHGINPYPDESPRIVAEANQSSGLVSNKPQIKVNSYFLSNQAIGISSDTVDSNTELTGEDESKNQTTNVKNTGKNQYNNEQNKTNTIPSDLL